MSVIQGGVNPPTSNQAPAVKPRTASAATHAMRVILSGLALTAVGLIITIVSFKLAHGGTFLVVFGPVIVGVLRIFQGMKLLAKAHRTNPVRTPTQVGPR